MFDYVFQQIGSVCVHLFVYPMCSADCVQHMCPSDVLSIFVSAECDILMFSSDVFIILVHHICSATVLLHAQ